MNQTLFLLILEAFGTVGVLFWGPIAGVVVYYIFAVFRPQYLWYWALPRNVSWSDYPAMGAIVGMVGVTFGMLPLGEHKDEPVAGLSATHAFFIGFACWIVLSYFTAYDQVIAWQWLLEYLTIFTMFFVSLFVVRTIPHTWALYLTALIPLLYHSYNVNSLYFFDGRLDIYRNGLGGLDNNGAGLTLAMSIPLALSAFEAEKRIWRWGYVACVPLVIHAVLVSYSRGAMVSLIVATPLMLLRARRKVLFLLIVAALASTVPFLAGNEIRARFFTVNEYETDASARSRFGSWNAAIRIANDHPLVGVGIRNANSFSYQYGADQEGRTIHSHYLQIAADSGWVALGFYVLTVVSLMFSSWRTRRRLKRIDHPEARRAVAMLNGIEGSLTVFCVGAFFLSLEVFELPYLLILTGAQLVLIARRDLYSLEPAPARVEPSLAWKMTPAQSPAHQFR
jgi:probable O-glycosylation ligase (exosortase A-associated)